MSETACYICGNPCYDWGKDSYSACGPCSNEVKKRSDSYKGVLPNPPIQDGFGKSAWTKEVNFAKNDWNLGLRTKCGVCGASCKNWNIGTYVYISVCNKCDREITNHKFGLSESRLNVEGNGYPNIDEWTKSIEFARNVFQMRNMKPGDRVEVSLDPGTKSETIVNATIVDDLSGDNRWMLALDRPHKGIVNGLSANSSSWNNSAIYASKAEKFGINTKEDTLLIVDPRVPSSKIVKVITNQNPIKEKSKMHAVSDLVQGDRVTLEIEDPSVVGGITYKQATYLLKGPNGDALLALDEEYHSNNYDSFSWGEDFTDLGVYDNILKQIAKQYLINTNIDNLWTIENSPDCETTIKSIDGHQVPNNQSGAGKTKMKDEKKAINYGEIFKSDMGKAVIRSGTTAGIDGLKAGIRKMLANEGVNNEGVAAVLKFLEGDLGEALLRAGLGNTLTFMPIPFIQENKYAQDISEELRVSGLEKGLTKGRKVLQEFIVPALMEAFANTPLMEQIMGSESKPRVAENVAPKRIAESRELAEELEVVEDPFKSAQARA